MTMPVTLTLEADFDRNDSYETDLTAYANLRGNGLVIDRGMDAMGELKVSQLTVTLDNISGTFSPLNSASSLFGLLGPHVPVRVVATHNSLDYTLWTGYIQEWRNRYGGPDKNLATFTAKDLGAYLVDGEPVNVLASVSRDSDGALEAIVEAIGLVVADDCDFDDGLQALPMHFCVGEKPMPALLAAVDSEMGGRLFVKADGKLRFEARDFRLGTTGSTWGDGTNIQCEDPELLLDPKDVVTTVRARATVFRSGQADTRIFEFSQNMFTKPTATSMALTAGEVWQRTFQANSAYLSLTTPDDYVDYTANAAANGTGTDKTSALTVTVTDHGGGRFTLKLVNTDASTVYVTKFQLRGQPVEFFADRAEAEFSLSVPGMKAGRSIEFDIPFAGDSGGKTRDYAYQVLRTFRYPTPVLTAPFPWDHDDTIVAMLGAELGDLVAFADLAPAGNANWATGADDWWYVESLRHDTYPGGMNRSAVTLLPSYIYRNLDAIVFDTFDRANASGDLGTSFNGHAWANDTGFDIASNAARANDVGLQTPNLAVF